MFWNVQREMYFTIMYIHLYLLTFTICLPVVCYVLSLHQSLYYQLLTTLTTIVKPDTASEMDNELLSELFTKNTERLHIANRFLEFQHTSTVTKNFSVLPVTYPVMSQANVVVYFSQQLSLWVEHVNTDAASTVKVVIISAGRDGVISNGQQFAPHYLTQNIARFMALISEHKYSDQVSFQLLVCCTGEHVTAEEKSLGRLVQLIRNPLLDSGFTFGPFHDRLAWRLVFFGQFKVTVMSYDD